MGRWLFGALVLASWGLATPAAAQQGAAPAEATEQGEGDESNKPDVAEARARFVAGSAAVEAGRWADAVDNFERAYELSSAPSALYNLGVALRALGRYRRARDVFDKLLTKHADELEQKMKRKAKSYRDEVAQQVASVELRGLSTDASYTIRFDGRRVGREGERSVLVETDPGNHALIVERPGHESFEWEGTLEAGERRSVRIDLEPRVTDTMNRPEASGKPAEDEGGVLTNPVFWGITSAVVVAAGLTVGGYYLFHDARELSPHSDMPVQVP